ncbi:MAG: SRPBCC family protein [Xanthomonadales bacterium]|nr:SRPBCC family protein [Xanthomonadales bacterium]
MNGNRYGELLAPDTVRFQRILPGNLDTVWRYLVDGEKRRKWLAGGHTEERVGGRVELLFHNNSLSTLPDDPPPEKYRDMPEQMTYTGEVTACEPKTLLRHTWLGDDGENSEVTYELEQRDDGVLLTLTHRRLGADMITGVLGGWHTHLDILEDVLSDREPKPFWRTHTALEAEYEGRI